MASCSSLHLMACFQFEVTKLIGVPSFGYFFQILAVSPNSELTGLEKRPVRPTCSHNDAPAAKAPASLTSRRKPRRETSSSSSLLFLIFSFLSLLFVSYFRFPSVVFPSVFSGLSHFASKRRRRNASGTRYLRTLAVPSPLKIPRTREMWLDPAQGSAP